MNHVVLWGTFIIAHMSVAYRCCIVNNPSVDCMLARYSESNVIIKCGFVCSGQILYAEYTVLSLAIALAFAYRASLWTQLFE